MSAPRVDLGATGGAYTAQARAPFQGVVQLHGVEPKGSPAVGFVVACLALTLALVVLS